MQNLTAIAFIVIREYRRFNLVQHSQIIHIFLICIVSIFNGINAIIGLILILQAGYVI